MSDAFQAYHKLNKERRDITMAGCWILAKQGFLEILKFLCGTGSKGTVAAEAESRISEIFHLGNWLDSLSKGDRERQRNLRKNPKVNVFFAWAKKILSYMAAQGQTAKSLQHCINHEQYLRIFHKNGDVPIGNSTAEWTIRPFTLDPKNWVTIDSMNGAKASSVIYNIVETANANRLNVYQYLELLFSEMPSHRECKDRTFLAGLPHGPSTFRNAAKAKVNLNSYIKVQKSMGIRYLGSFFLYVALMFDSLRIGYTTL